MRDARRTRAATYRALALLGAPYPSYGVEERDMPSQGMPDRKTTVDVAEYDLAASRAKQLKQQGEEKDGYRTCDTTELDGAGLTG